MTALPNEPPTQWTPEMIQAEADDFLAACKRAAASMVRLADMQQAHEALLDAMLVVSEFHKKLDEEFARTIDPASKRERPAYGKRGGV